MDDANTERLKRYVEERADDARSAFIDNWNDDYGLLVKKSESPIESLFLGFLMLISDGYNYVKFRPEWSLDHPPKFGTIAGLQVPVGGYRADFYFRCSALPMFRDLVVECDGHDYHERTKEQARRDKRRDRWMTANGITVLRFTGSEIYADQEKCADEVSSHLMKLLDEMLVAQGEIRGRKRDPLA